MPKLLLNLRQVPDDEADEVRDVLRAARIDYYETPPNRWGISAGGIWITDEEEVPEAERLMAQYQIERAARARDAHTQARRSGKAMTFARLFREQPTVVLVALITIACMLALMWLPVFLLSR